MRLYRGKERLHAGVYLWSIYLKPYDEYENCGRLVTDYGRTEPSGDLANEN